MIQLQLITRFIHQAYDVGTNCSTSLDASCVSHPEKLAGDYKKILIDGDLDFLKEAPFWNQEMKKIKFPMDVQKSYKLSKLIP